MLFFCLEKIPHFVFPVYGRHGTERAPDHGFAAFGEETAALAQSGVQKVGTVQGESLGRRGNTSRSVLRLPMMTGDEMLEVHDKLRFQSGFLQEGFQQDESLDDVPEQFAFVGVVRVQKTVHFVNLSDVVQQCRGQQGLAVQLRIVIGHEHTKSGHGKEVLQQTACVGVVYGTRRRSLKQQGAEALVAEYRTQELAPWTMGEDFVAQGFNVGQHVFGGARAGLHIVVQRQSSRFLFGQDAQVIQGKLELVAVQGDSPLRFHHLPGGKAGEGLAQRTPDFGFHEARCIFQFQPPVRAVAGLLERGRMDNVDVADFIACAKGVDISMFCHESAL